MLHSYRKAAPITMKSLPGILLILLLAAAPFLWLSHRAKSASKEPTLDGEWVGAVRVVKYYEGLGEPRPMEKRGSFCFKLKMYDSFQERYRGDGEMVIEGDRPRAIHIPDISLGDWFQQSEKTAAHGASRLSGMLTGDLESPGPGDDSQDIQGSASSTRIQFRTVDIDPGYGFEVDLHRGKRAEYEAGVKTLKQAQYPPHP